VRLTIYDVTGKSVRKMELGHLTAGSYSQTEKAIYWDGKTETGEMVSSGTYFYQIQAGDYTEIKKMVVLK
jgi:flagellar hook assembly protein FlgD